MWLASRDSLALLLPVQRAPPELTTSGVDVDTTPLAHRTGNAMLF